MKSLALASRPQVLENWPVLGSRTALIFELLKYCGVLEKFFWKTFFCGHRLKNFCEDFFFGEHLRLCPWSLALASSITVLGLESVCPRKGCPWPWPRIFLCPWPWPRALCPRLILCLIPSEKFGIKSVLIQLQYKWYKYGKNYFTQFRQLYVLRRGVFSMNARHALHA